MYDLVMYFCFCIDELQWVARDHGLIGVRELKHYRCILKQFTCEGNGCQSVSQLLKWRKKESLTRFMCDDSWNCR